MPFTPFHFGPGVAIKAAIPKSFSLVVFCGTQVFVDLETGYYLLRHEYPLHRFLHTFLGAVVAGAICGVLGFGLFRLAGRWRADLRISWSCAFLSSFIGSFSHVLLDGIMHQDLQPFAPWSSANPFLGWVGLAALHGFCMIAGVVGLIAWGFRCLPKELA